MNHQQLKRLSADLVKIQATYEQYQQLFSADGTISATEQAALDKLGASAQKTAQHLKKLQTQQQAQLEQVDISTIDSPKAFEQITKDLQTVLPDLVPVSKTLLKGCSLNVMNYGSVQLEDATLL